MAKLIINEEESQIVDGESIKDCCMEMGIPFGCEEGVCGTCIVEVEEGMENLSPYAEEEADFLGDMGCERLACQCKILKGTVKIRY